MLKFMGAKQKDKDTIRKSNSEKKWWKFMRKSKVKPVRQLDIQHNVQLKRNENFGSNIDDCDEMNSEYYEMGNYNMDRDSNHYR